jgi:hypothetical protein
MAPENRHEEVVILVKAIPHPSKRHGETVCCAGVTLDGQWRRLFPVRFRHLNEKFSRWDRLAYTWRQPTNDKRQESRHVYEDTFLISKAIPQRERATLLRGLERGSARDASARGESLALVRPSGFEFFITPRSEKDIQRERDAYAAAAMQSSLLDKDLATIEPLPFKFRARFRDEAGSHDHQCEDWETSAAYWKLQKTGGHDYAINHLLKTYNDVYPTKGLALALGTMASRPQTWLLLGVLRLDNPVQGSLF